MKSELPLVLARNINEHITDSDITLLSGGYSSQAYKVESDGDSYILLMQKDGAVSGSQYGHSFVVLKLLAVVGYAYAPKPIWLHSEKTAMIISFFDGTASDIFDFNKAAIDPLDLSLRVIDALLDTGTIIKNDYDDLCKEYDVEPLPVLTIEEHAQQIGTDWFVIVEESCPDIDIVDWLRGRVASSVEYANSMTPNKPTLGLGDPSNPNILIAKTGEFMLIDWDSSSFNTEGPEYYVSYTTHLTDFMRPFKKEIIEHVAQRVGVSYNDLARRIFEYSRYYQVFDVNWAAMMMVKVASGEVQGNIETFRKIAIDRIAKYEESFESK